jgi:cell wall-associated NlpC family hydrolase
MSEIEVFTSIEDLPLDEWNGEDGDNSLLEQSGGEGVGLPSQAQFEEWGRLDLEEYMRPLDATATLVPYKRVIKLGTIGHDAYAVKRALSRAGHGPWGGWGTRPRLFGPYAVRNLKNFQKRKGLRVDGVYGSLTHQKLSPYFDAYGRWLMGQTKVISSTDSKRQRIVATAMHGYRNRYGIHYTQSSLRMQGVRNRIMPPGYPRYEDCSSFATWCYWVAGARDPNGLGYNGYGFTGTLASQGKRVWASSMKPGDLVFYGSSPHNHVTIYVGNGRCVSHGSEIGPLLLPYNYRTVNHCRSYL